MSIRFDLPDETEKRIRKIIDKNFQEILLHSRLVGTKKVKNWASHLTRESLKSNNSVISDETNMISFEELGVAQKITHLIQDLFPDKTVTPSGFFHYPPTGYMGWHTNSNSPGRRLYLTWTKEGRKSFFRYLEGDSLVTDYDDEGLTTRLFDATDIEPLFWHCVGSETDRLSFGFSIK